MRAHHVRHRTAHTRVVLHRKAFWQIVFAAGVFIIEWRRWIVLGAALALLNASVTYDNVWPTLGVRPGGRLSIEVCVVLLAIGVAVRRFSRFSPSALAAVTAVWMVLVLGRYTQVTALALYGREINVYWDIRFVPDLMAMVTRVAPPWLIGLTMAGVAVGVALVSFSMGWALRQTCVAMASARVRTSLMAGASAMVVLFVLQRASGRVPFHTLFAEPVAPAFTRQIQLVAEARARSRPLPAGPALDSDLSLVDGADVLLVFIESYGAVSYDRPEFARSLARSRTQLESDIGDTNRRVVSAFVTSPTFGGSSWLAHVSLLTGVEIRDAHAYAQVLSESRPTLLDVFSRHGYRTVALMPGLQKLWPEGRSYRFDEIYSAARLDYQGPQFGWFGVPDQISMERVDRFELRRTPHVPVFVFFPTINTHFPFSPTPPYQSEWRRVGGPAPFDDVAVDAAYVAQPDWTDLGPAYIEALSYDFQVVGGFLRHRPGRDLVMILIGDHQPPAAVSGEGASWEVPVHVVTSRHQLLERLIARGFRTGLTPERPTLGAMHTLLPALLDAFGDEPQENNRVPSS